MFDFCVGMVILAPQTRKITINTDGVCNLGNEIMASYPIKIFHCLLSMYMMKSSVLTLFAFFPQLCWLNRLRPVQPSRVGVIFSLSTSDSCSLLPCRYFPAGNGNVLPNYKAFLAFMGARSRMNTTKFIWRSNIKYWALIMTKGVWAFWWEFLLYLRHN